MIAAPIMSRLFSPEDYGVAGLIQQIIALVTMFACLGYAQAIPLSSTRGEAHALIRLSFIFTVLLVVPLLLLPLFGGDFLADILGQAAIKPLLWFVPVIFLLISLRSIVMYTFSWARRFGGLAAVEVSAACGARPFQIASGWRMGGSPLFLLLGVVFGLILSLGIAALTFVRILRKKNPDDQPSEVSMLEAAKRHQQFPKVQIWNLLLNEASRALPMMLMGALFGVAALGYYVTGQRLVLLPFTILGASLAQVFYPEAAEEWRETRGMWLTIEKTVRILAATCVFPVATVGLLGPVLFDTILGHKWYEAGVYAQILSPWVMAGVISSPLSSVLLIRNRAKRFLVYSALLAILCPAALLIGKRISVAAMPFPAALLPEQLAAVGKALVAVCPAALLAQGWLGGARLSLLLLCAVGTAVNLHLLATALRLGKGSRRFVADVMLKETLRACLLLSPAAIAWYFFQSQPYWRSYCFGFLGVAMLAHAVLLYRREPVIREKISQFFYKVRGGQ